VHSVSWVEDSSSFVTVGEKYCRFWTVDAQLQVSKVTGPGTKGVKSLDNRSVSLGQHKDCTFFDVCCGRGSAHNNTFVITDTALLCVINNTTKTLEKWIHLKTEKAFSISFTEKFICCGCSDGVVRLFDTNTLQYVATTPKPSALGYEVKHFSSQQNETSTKSILATQSKVYPHTLVVKFMSDNTRLVCGYSNRSIFIWNLRNPNKIGKFRSFLSHSACIWDIDIYTIHNHPRIPFGTFVTCSADSSIRFWNLDEEDRNPILRNVYSKELIESLTLVDPKDLLRNVVTTESIDVGSSGVRCIKLSPDGEHLASGDRNGNLRVHELRHFQCVSYTEAHDAEILTLDYTGHNGSLFLASGSRDRLIHIFQCHSSRDDIERQQYTLKTTLDEHSSSITSVKFAEEGAKLISSSADKSIIFRNITQNGEHSTRYSQVKVYGTIYDMRLDANEKFLLAAGQEKRISIFDVSTGKFLRAFSTDSEGGETVRAELDPSGQFLATSSQDRYIRLYQFASAELIAKATGHSEVVTGLKFTPDGQRLISVSGDGCIFIWRLPDEVSDRIHDKLNRLKPNFCKTTAILSRDNDKENITLDNVPHGIQKTETDIGWMFHDIAELPHWAQKLISIQQGRKFSNDNDKQKSATCQLAVQNRWTKRASEAITIACAMNEAPVIVNISGVCRHGLTAESTPTSERHQQNQTSVNKEKREGTDEEETIYLDDEVNTTTTSSPESQQFQISNSSTHQSESQSCQDVSVAPAAVHPHPTTNIGSANDTMTSETTTENGVELGLSFPELREDNTQFEIFKDSSEVFMKSNFTSLGEKFLPPPHTNPNRLSLSTLYLKKVTPTVSASTTMTTATATTATLTTTKQSETSGMEEQNVAKELNTAHSTDCPTTNRPVIISSAVSSQNDTMPNEIRPISKSPLVSAVSESNNLISAATLTSTTPSNSSHIGQEYFNSESEKIRERKEQLAKEVERTRQRLQQLGQLMSKSKPTTTVTSKDTPFGSQRISTNESFGTGAENEISMALSNDSDATQTQTQTQTSSIQEPTVLSSTSERTQTKQSDAEPNTIMTIKMESEPKDKNETVIDLHTQAKSDTELIPNEENAEEQEESETMHDDDDDDPYMDAITQLQRHLHYTLQLFYYLKEQQEQNVTARLLVEQYLSTFSFMKEQLSQLFVSETANCQQQYEQQLLEKYSHALLSLFTEKINKSLLSKQQPDE